MIAKFTWRAATLAATLLASTTAANAALTLTAAGIADGFSLTQYSSDPAANYGMLGLATMSNGRVIGTGYARAQLYSLADTDGQTYPSASVTVSAAGTPTSAATVGGVTYVNALGGGYHSVDPTTLALTPIALNSPVSAGYGLWANRVTGHLGASTLDNRLVDIDPLTGAVHTITSGTFYDGVSISNDGLTIYGANGGGLFGFNIATGASVLSVLSGHGADGTGVISGSAFDGYIIVNNNDGTVGIINPLTGIETTIASGGSRGDLVGPDGNNGSLFLTQSEGEWRLAIAGGVIGGGVPEPATWAMLLAGFGAIGGRLRSRQRLTTVSA